VEKYSDYFHKRELTATEDRPSSDAASNSASATPVVEAICRSVTVLHEAHLNSTTVHVKAR